MRVIRIFTLLLLIVFSFTALYVFTLNGDTPYLCGINFITNIICDGLKTSKFRRDYDYGDNTCGDNPDREVLHGLFKRWVEISKINNISYFVTTGTLLGAWRDGDIIPYDRDVDVLIDGQDNVKLDLVKDKRNFDETDDRFHLIMQEDWRKPYKERRRFKCDGKLVSHYSDHCSFEEPLGRLIKGRHHLDIYDYKVENGSVSDPSEWDKKYMLSDVFPLKMCKFMGITTYCPQNPKNILKAFYGDDLNPTIKCKDKRWIHLRNETKLH